VAENEFVRIGWIGRTRGVHGDSWVTPDTDFPERFLKLEEVFVRIRNQWEPKTIAAASMIGGRPVLRLEGVTSPEDARRLTNCELAVTRDQVWRLPKGSHYIFDLVGCAVVDEDGGRLGELEMVETYPANDVYIIRTGDDRRLFLAAVRPFVKKIDTEARTIVVDRDGLFDGLSGKRAAENEV